MDEELETKISEESIEANIDVNEEMNSPQEEFSQNENEIYGGEEIDFSDFEKQFFAEVQSGKPYLHFLNLNSQVDCMIIRSMLASMKIPTYIEGDNVNRIYGSGASFLSNIFNIKLYILLEDYDEAFSTVKDYINNKLETLTKDNEKNNYKKARAILEMLVAVYIISDAQEILGITIMPKKNPDEKKKEGFFTRLKKIFKER